MHIFPSLKLIVYSAAVYAQLFCYLYHAMPCFFNASILIRSVHVSCRLPFLFAISATSLSFLFFPHIRRKAANSFTSLRLMPLPIYNTFYKRCISSLLGLAVCSLGFHSRTVRLTMVFLLLRSTYTVVSPVCWLTLGVASSITSSSILHPNVCTPPRNFQYFCGVAGFRVLSR